MIIVAYCPNDWLCVERAATQCFRHLKKHGFTDLTIRPKRCKNMYNKGAVVFTDWPSIKRLKFAHGAEVSIIALPTLCRRYGVEASWVVPNEKPTGNEWVSVALERYKRKQGAA